MKRDEEEESIKRVINDLEVDIQNQFVQNTEIKKEYGNKCHELRGYGYSDEEIMEIRRKNFTLI